MKEAIASALSRARKHAREIGAAESLHAQEEAWTDFLVHWRRAINIADRIGRKAFGSDWHSPKKDIVADELLNYLKEARDRFEHSDIPVTRIRGAGKRLSSNGPIEIRGITSEEKSLPLAPGEFEISGLTPGEEIEIQIQPWGIGGRRQVQISHRSEAVVPAPLMQDGRAEAVPLPSNHAGGSIDPNDINAMASLALEYAERLGREASAG